MIYCRHVKTRVNLGNEVAVWEIKASGCNVVYSIYLEP